MRRKLSLFVLLSSLATFASAESIQLSDAWVSEAPPGVNVNAAFLKIYNTGDKSVILNAVSSPDFKKVEMHRSLVAEGNASMQLQSQLEIKAASVFSFEPGDYHLMLFKPQTKLSEGDTTTLILHFASGSEISVNAEVRKLQLDHQHHH
jgi:periplasmic copper chaperone A